MLSVKWVMLIGLLGIMATGYGGLCAPEDSGSSVTVAAPSNLAGTIPTVNIMLTWQDNSDNETAFVLYGKAWDATEWTLLTSTIPASATSYSFPASALGVTGNYYFCLTAYNSPKGVESAASNIINLSW
jgi:hypothetical protein